MVRATPPATAPQRRHQFELNLEGRIGHVLRRAYQRHVSIFQQAMSDYKLTAAQFIVLATLMESGEQSQSDLVRQTAIDQATIRGIIDRLKARHLVITQVDVTDARKVTVRLTAQGEEVAMGASAHVDEISEATYNGLNNAERVAVLYLLRRMADMGPADAPDEPSTAGPHPKVNGGRNAAA